MDFRTAPLSAGALNQLDDPRNMLLAEVSRHTDLRF
jgi:hypothetical protein